MSQHYHTFQQLRRPIDRQRGEIIWVAAAARAIRSEIVAASNRRRGVK